MEKKEQNKYAWKLLVLVLMIGLLAGLVGGVLSAQIFIKPGPQGIPGANGTNSILQMIHNRSDTQVEISGYTEMQWYNISEFDHSMKITINVNRIQKSLRNFQARIN